MSARISCKKQVPELRILQSLAFLAVILQSALSYTIAQPGIMPAQAVMIGILFNLAKFSAPAFIFIVGFTLFYHHEKQVHYQHYILEKVSELIVPYIAWSAIYLLVSQQAAIPSSATAIQALQAILAGTAAPHLWYVVMMFQIHLLFPILFVLFHWFRQRVHSTMSLYRLIGAFALAYLLLMWASSHYIFNGSVLTSSTLLQYTDRSFVLYSFYFILGGVAAATLPKWRRFIVKYAPLNTFIFLALFLTVGYELLSFDNIRDIHLQASTYLKPSMSLYVITEIMLLYALSITIVQSRTFLYRLLSFIGRYTYGAYLGHFFILQLCVWILESFSVPAHSIIYAFLLFALTTAASIGFIVLMTFIPLGKLIAGPAVKPDWRLPAFIPPAADRVKRMK